MKKTLTIFKLADITSDKHIKLSTQKQAEEMQDHLKVFGIETKIEKIKKVIEL